ncbi:HDOD domain-containing protein [Marichromatium gracile]|uniref:HD-like signal output (HDOD) protein n=1 Tax=Marichromatium gracile TaxID=1048 RepID=A0A4R4AJP1_MARGR|nr:HDOD domain-containing protein [Marichromatium gracile]TCW39612.1 HD-like signal output (HDOD) protein [Marichromatium gracile]
MNTQRTPQKRRLAEWVELIQHHEMPIFNNTVHQVLRVSEDELAPAAALAQVIMQDPSLTTRILKLANSVHYNPAGASTGHSLTTVNRAVVVLGFNAVSNMCLAATLVDDTIEGATRERVARELARALHAAIQARSIATAREDKAPEEVFIAALLHRIGELAFWCFGGEQAEALDQLYRQQPSTLPERAQERILGFRLNQLSGQLAKVWNLNELVREAIVTPSVLDERVQTVVLGQQIALCAEDGGWHTEPMEKLVKRAAKMIDLAIGETHKMLQHNASEAAEVAAVIGAQIAAPHIPQQQETSDQPTPETATETAAAATTDAESTAPEPDAQLQLRVLRELSTLIESGTASLNQVMTLALEGIHRGVGMDRVVFALITPDKRTLKARYTLGSESERLLARFQFTRLPGQNHLLFTVIERQQARCIRGEALADVPATVIQALGRTPFMIAPIEIAGQGIGLLYADRASSARALTEPLFEDFQHFAKQASQGLTLAARRRAR